MRTLFFFFFCTSKKDKLIEEYSSKTHRYAMHAHAVPVVNSQPSSLSALGLLTQYSTGLPLSP